MAKRLSVIAPEFTHSIVGIEQQQSSSSSFFKISGDQTHLFSLSNTITIIIFGSSSNDGEYYVEDVYHDNWVDQTVFQVDGITPSETADGSLSKWVVPKKVYRWDGNNWNVVSFVNRWDGSSWIKHWPLEGDLQTSVDYYQRSIGPVYSALDNRGGFRGGPWKTVQVPQSILDSNVSYVTKVTLYHTARLTGDGDFFGGLDERVGMAIEYEATGNPPEFPDAHMTSVREVGPFSTFTRADGDINEITYNSLNSPIVGFRFRVVADRGGDNNNNGNLGSSFVGAEFFILEADVTSPSLDITLESTANSVVSDTDFENLNDKNSNYSRQANASAGIFADTIYTNSNNFINGVHLGTASGSDGNFNDDNWGDYRPYKARVQVTLSRGVIKQDN